MAWMVTWWLWSGFDVACNSINQFTIFFCWRFNVFTFSNIYSLYHHIDYATIWGCIFLKFWW